MDYEIGLCECLALILPEDRRLGHGSGMLLDDRHIVTCAHVVDRQYRQDRYEEELGLEDRLTVSRALAEKIGKLTATVRLYDGIERRAHLLAVDTQADLVLLRLDDPLPFEINPPRPPLNGIRLEQTMGLSAFGFQWTDPHGYAYHESPLSPSAKESRNAGKVTAFSGTAEGGMSGSPVFYKDAENFCFLGILTLGGQTVDHTHSIRDKDVVSFVTRQPALSHLFSSDKAIGLPASFSTFLGENGDKIEWIRCTPSGETLYSAKGRVEYLASLPLSLGHVDCLMGVHRNDLMREARARSLAEFSIDEAGKVCELLSTLAGFPIRPPSLAVLNCLFQTSPETTDTFNENPGERIANLPLGIPQLRRSGKYMIEPDSAAQWVEDPQISKAFIDSKAGKPKRESLLNGHSSQRGRALLRPSLSFQLWGYHEYG